MIPKLYDVNETDFLTNGLGSLPDALSCVVIEERNGKYELEMLYPTNGLHYEDIKHSRLIYAVPSDRAEAQPFRIYSISKPLNMRVTIRAEHISYQMSHIPVTPCTASSVASALLALKNHASEDCPFNFWTDMDAKGTFNVKEPASMRSKLGGSDGSILDTFGGEWEFDKYNVKLHKERGADRGVTLRYGKNITDIKQEENIQNTYTGILPYWKGTDDNQEESIVMLSEVIRRAANYKNFPFNRTISVDLSSEFESKPTEVQLRSAADAYIKANDIGKPSVSLTVSFIALWQTEEYQNIANVERVRLCDTVTVQFEKLGISATAKVIRTEYNVLLERYNSIDLGETRSTLSSSIQSAVDTVRKDLSQFSTKSYLQKSVKRASDLITGGLGGYVVVKLNANEQPEEILILSDDMDYLKTTKLWRWNKNGLGYSKTGYNGSYGIAITNDGHFVADFIDTGTLTANIIRAGILTDTKGKNYWNLETGEFAMKSGNIKLGDNFSVNSNGNMVASNVTLNGRLLTETSSEWVRLRNGILAGGKKSGNTYTQTGKIVFKNNYQGNINGMSLQAANIMLSGNLWLSQSENPTTVTKTFTGNKRIVMANTDGSQYIADLIFINGMLVG